MSNLHLIFASCEPLFLVPGSTQWPKNVLEHYKNVIHILRMLCITWDCILVNPDIVYIPSTYELSICEFTLMLKQVQHMQFKCSLPFTDRPYAKYHLKAKWQ